MKIVGLTASISDGVNKVNGAYVKAFTTDNITPIIIPMFKLKSSEVFTAENARHVNRIVEHVCNKCDALVLTGGNDINPVGMGNTFTGSVFTNHNRDVIEMSLVEQFIKMNKPVIGICRGFQVLGVMYGLKLSQELSMEENQHEIHNGNSLELPARDEPCHEIELCGDFKEWAQIDKMKVNSWHHQGMLLAGNHNSDVIKNNLEVLAKTSKVIEGFRHKTLPMVAFQFHPEEFDDSWTIQYILDRYLK